MAMRKQSEPEGRPIGPQDCLRTRLIRGIFCSACCPCCNTKAQPEAA
jgi:hypothetical protein